MYLDCLDKIMTVWLGAPLDKVYTYTSYYIDCLIKLEIRTSCDDILDHPSHHGHIVYSKCACMQVYTVYTAHVCMYVQYTVSLLVHLMFSSYTCAVCLL